MRLLSKKEIPQVAGGIWSSYEGELCSSCANMIQIQGDDCSIIKDQILVQRSTFDTSGFIIGSATIWSGAIVGLAAGTMFGGAASCGVGLVFGLAIGAAYSSSQNG